MVADGLAVALGGVLAAAQVELRLGRRGRAANAGRAQGGGDQPGLGRGADRRRPPLVEQPDHRVHVVDLDLPGDVGPPEAELAGGRDGIGERVLGAGREGRTAAVCAGRGDPGAVPELDREGPLGKGALDLADQRLGRHGPTLAWREIQFVLGRPNLTHRLGMPIGCQPEPETKRRRPERLGQDHHKGDTDV